MLGAENRWAAIDDIIERLNAENRANLDKMTSADYYDLLPHLIKSMEPKYLPSIDLIDPDKMVLHYLADFFETGDMDKLLDMADFMKEQLTIVLKGRIGNIIDAKIKTDAKPEDII